MTAKQTFLEIKRVHSSRCSSSDVDVYRQTHPGEPYNLCPNESAPALAVDATSALAVKSATRLVLCGSLPDEWSTLWELTIERSQPVAVTRSIPMQDRVNAISYNQSLQILSVLMEKRVQLFDADYNPLEKFQLGQNEPECSTYSGFCSCGSDLLLLDDGILVMQAEFSNTKAKSIHSEQQLQLFGRERGTYALVSNLVYAHSMIDSNSIYSWAAQGMSTPGQAGDHHGGNSPESRADTGHDSVPSVMPHTGLFDVYGVHFATVELFYRHSDPHRPSELLLIAPHSSWIMSGSRPPADIDLADSIFVAVYEIT